MNNAVWMVGLVLAAAGCGRKEAPPVAADAAGAVTVTMTDFAYAPDHLVLRAGVPTRLHLVNTTGGGHDFSAPKLFAASELGEGAVLVRDGSVEVAKHASVDVVLTPRMPGRYDVVCTHPLHELFGMSGGVEVVP